MMGVVYFPAGSVEKADHPQRFPSLGALRFLPRQISYALQEPQAAWAGLALPGLPGWVLSLSHPNAQAEFEAAMMVVQRYLAVQGEADRAVAGAPEGTAGSAHTDAIAVTEPPIPLAPPAGTQMSVDGNVDATSFSGSGALMTDLPWANLTGIPGDLADGDDDTIYSAQHPIQVGGTTFSLSSAGCSSDDYLRWSSSSWGCDPGASLSCNVESLGFTTASQTVTCPGGTVVTGGGFDLTDGSNIMNWNQAVSRPNGGNGWFCSREVFLAGSAATCYAVCCAIQ